MVNVIQGLAEEALLVAVGEMHPKWTLKQQNQAVRKMIKGMTAEDMLMLFEEYTEL
jgi:hypothetical protein